MRDAEPNEGHRALASLYQAGRLKAVITQNIDSVWYFMAHPTANFFQYLSLLSHHTETKT